MEARMTAFSAGMLRAAEILREMAAKAAVDEPSAGARPLCLTHAAEQIERESHKPQPRSDGPLFGGGR